MNSVKGLVALAVSHQDGVLAGMNFMSVFDNLTVHDVNAFYVWSLAETVRPGSYLSISISIRTKQKAKERNEVKPAT